MKESIKNILRENIQQADKIYFNTGKLPKEARDAILSITNGDVYTKLIADLVYHFSKFGGDLSSGYKLGQKLYKQIKEYDKNVLPLPYNILDFNAEDSDKHIMNLMEYLEYRERALFYLKQLPSTLVRNLKPELRKPVTHQYDFQRLGEKLKELWGLVKHIPNTEKGEKALKKVAASNNSIDDMIELANHFAYAFNDRAEDTTKEDVLETAEEFNLKVLQDSNDIVMLKVDSHEAMKAIGCTSVWCFALPNSDEFWDEYADYTGYVIVIFDFKQDYDDSTFMMVYLPDRSDVYSATNVPLEQLGIEASNEYLQKIGVDMSKLYEPDAPEPHYDPNQLSLDLKESKKLIKKLLRENLYSEEYDSSKNVLYGYHVTGNNPKSLEAIRTNGFIIGQGRMEGQGVYAFYELERASGYSSKERNTNIVIKFEISDVSKVLILDMDIAKEVLGDEFHLPNQLNKYFKGGLDYTYSDCKSVTGDYFPTKDSYIKELYEIEVTDSRSIAPELFTMHSAEFEDSVNVINYGTYGLQYRINTPEIIRVLGYYELEPFTKNIINYTEW